MKTQALVTLKLWYINVVTVVFFFFFFEIGEKENFKDCVSNFMLKYFGFNKVNY
jgi:hypothetical protein